MMKADPRQALIAFDFLKAKTLKQNIPIAVTWAVTYRCNYKCSHCYRWTGSPEELSIDQAKNVLDKLDMLGVRRINFTGGEPLLKENFCDLINLAKQKGILTFLNTNGSLVPQYIKDLKNVNLVNISIEGDRTANDSIRGEGSYMDVLRAAEAAQKAHIKFRFSATINKFNQDCLLDLIRLAKNFDTTVTFQILEIYRLGSKIKTPILLSDDALRISINNLIGYKNDPKYRSNIGNSMNGLQYLVKWPDLEKKKCVIGGIAHRIEPEGIIYPCSKRQYDAYYEIDLRNKNIDELKEAFKALRLDQFDCACGCANIVETNLIWNMKFQSIYEIFKL